MDVFGRYAPFIQDYIYRSGWQMLRGVQNAAGEAIFGTDENVLLTASTASGKTEAAFFPIITLMQEDPPRSIGCLYIAPLKALINDQFVRLNDICAESGIPVWHWHGDVSQTHKQKLMKRPSGILQITPESLEAMLLHRQGKNAVYAATPPVFSGTFAFVACMVLGLGLLDGVLCVLARKLKKPAGSLQERRDSHDCNSRKSI